MSLWTWLTRKRTDRGWPGYVLNGRIRTSTAALLVAFFAISWVHNNYQPAPPAPAPETAVVPPGFVPDPEYTWVPRTNVQKPRVTTTTPTTTSTEPTTTTPTTSEPTDTTSVTPDPNAPTTGAPTTLIDPDGPGPLSAVPVPTTVGPSASVSPVPNRSGAPAPGPAPTTGPAPGTTPTAPPPGQ